VKVYAECHPQYSQGIHRIVRALKAHAPDAVTFVDRLEDADLRVLHVIGWGSIPWSNPVYPDHVDPVPGMPYAVAQYCVRTSEDPRGDVWRGHVWAGSRLTWSYYDLATYDVAHPGPDGWAHYKTALGVDADVFRQRGPVRKRFHIGTSGYVAETEGVPECYRAIRRLPDGEMFHLGPRVIDGEGITYATGIPDDVLASLWSLCLHVAGLRRIEGFELPAAEGLLCGARPIMFDAPHYRDWFGDMAEYVPEVEPAAVEDAIAGILTRPYRAVTDAEVSHARTIFNWPAIVRGFWERLL
jgi:hypothetical protein